MNLLKVKASLRLFKSKTIAFFGAMGAIVFPNITPLMGYITDAMPQLKDYLPDNPYKTLGTVLITGGIVLRFFTKDSLKDKTKDPNV